MSNATERLTSLRVRDVMNRNVLTVLESDDMQVAAKQIFENEVTGAPVVNAVGKCVGMLSASDFVARDAGEHELHILKRTSARGPYEIASLNDNLVGTHMSPVLQTVSEEESILTAARIMCAEFIHRLVVVDEHDRPVAILSTLDLVAALVAAVEE